MNKATGLWRDLDEIGDLWRPATVIEPDPGVDRGAVRAEWAEAVTRVEGWIPDLSALDF